MGKKTNRKRNAMIGLAVIISLAICYLIAMTAYRYGYANGTKNQIICQASESQESLKQICVR